MDQETVIKGDLFAILRQRKELEMRASRLCRMRKHDAQLHVARAMLCHELAESLAERRIIQVHPR